MAKHEKNDHLPPGALRVELQPTNLPSTKFSVILTAHVMSENVILSFGHVDPTAIQPGRPLPATAFERIAIGRSTFTAFLAQGIAMLAKTTDRDMFGFRDLQKQIDEMASTRPERGSDAK